MGLGQVDAVTAIDLCGYLVATEVDGRKGMELAKTDQFDIILQDNIELIGLGQLHTLTAIDLCGYQVTTEVDGRNRIDLPKTHQLEIILLELTNPHITGITVSRQVRAAEHP